ncbi:MAG: 1,4-alpha-glucan branching protein domain-containing protein [Candidatus Sumerlaeia bacterium]
MSAIGYQCLVLHAHLPFVRHPEYEESLEERWLFDALTECYLPLLSVIDGWRRDGLGFGLTLSLTPTLLAMLRDDLLMGRYRRHLDRLVDLAHREVTRTRLMPEFNNLARHYLERFEACRRNLDERWGGDPAGAFAAIAREGQLELLGGPATHPFLPLFLHEPESIRAQLRIGLAETERQLGIRPPGLWSPECGWAPGLDIFMRTAGIGYTFVDAHGLIAAWPPQPGVHAPVRTPAGMVIFGRDPETSRQVWNARIGYPGDPAYREFYRDIGHDLDREWLGELLPGGVRANTGIKYHRVTGPVGLGDKAIYDSNAVVGRTAAHAEHFVNSRAEQAKKLGRDMDRPPLIVSPYDAELFGHWWYEGPMFLDAAMRRLCAPDSPIVPVTPTAYLRRHGIASVAQPAFSSWGEGGYAQIWLNEMTEWIYPRLDAAARSMRTLAAREDLDALAQRALTQMGRELLLAQASDWPFLIRIGSAPHYARQRLEEHLGSIERLAQQIKANAVDEPWLADLESRHNIFPKLDYKAFA